MCHPPSPPCQARRSVGWRRCATHVCYYANRYSYLYLYTHNVNLYVFVHLLVCQARRSVGWRRCATHVCYYANQYSYTPPVKRKGGRKSAEGPPIQQCYYTLSMKVKFPGADCCGVLYKVNPRWMAYRHGSAVVYM